MKILQSSQEYLARVGIEPSQLAKKQSINKKQLIVFILLSLNLLLGGLYLCYETKNIKEFVDSFFWTTSCAVVLFDYIIYAYTVEGIFEFIENFENLILTSELNGSNNNNKYMYLIFTTFIELQD